MTDSQFKAKILRVLADAIEAQEKGGAVAVIVEFAEGSKIFLPKGTTLEDLDRMLSPDAEVVILEDKVLN